ncbi:hypothetical protein JYU34_018306 [Plutella xylostella]|uniref:Uncharacterized protein n=1 Tax=Plutella xylostella TaxID=51655 RepID=A0ABQ7Q0A0_PLUXY|nr:hypothetical protein JYU34_018306 [Plutella xylostella]
MPHALRVMYWNPRGISGHASQLRSLVPRPDIHVVLLGWTKLAPKASSTCPTSSCTDAMRGQFSFPR